MASDTPARHPPAASLIHCHAPRCPVSCPSPSRRRTLMCLPSWRRCARARPARGGGVLLCRHRARPPRHQRAAPDAAVASLELEHYPGMTEKAIAAMVDAARQHFDILGARIITAWACFGAGANRAGGGEQRAPGRSFQACEFLMDYLKPRPRSEERANRPGGALGGCARQRLTPRWRAGAIAARNA